MNKRVTWLLSLITCIIPFSKLQSETGDMADSCNQGIRFEHGLSWSQILAKAKEENKLIFIDCYTTWCAPCKQMEKSVYSLQQVGVFFNKHFISLKLQMNRTSDDEENVKKWYEQTKRLEKEFFIDAYPTFIFLSSDGKLLHRASGFFPMEKFINLAADALDPDKQSYTLVAKYDTANMKTDEMKNVALSFKYTNPQFAKFLALIYLNRVGKNIVKTKENLDFIIQFKDHPEIVKGVNGYLETLTENELLKERYIDFLREMMQGSKDIGFRLFYKHFETIDHVKNKGSEHPYWFTKKWIDYIIYKEEVDPLLTIYSERKSNPDWIKLYNTIRIKYNNEYAQRNLYKAKINWYKEKRNWKECNRNIILYMDSYGLKMETDWGLNENAWNLFLSSNDQLELAKALEWSSRAIIIYPTANWIDTYANLLYKMGRKESAINWQRIATKLDPNDEGIKNNLEKMLKGKPTWRSIN